MYTVPKLDDYSPAALDRAVADLAVNDAAGFTALCTQAKSAHAAAA